MQLLSNELRVEIFKRINVPISLILTDRKWYTFSRDPQSRAKWLIHKYGKAHALFHAVRLGNSFMTPEVLQALLTKNVIISRYFLQRLLMNFGGHDERLMRERNAHYQNFNVINAIQPSPWAGNLPLIVFTTLITEGNKIFINHNNLVIRGNDMELFHYLSAGPLVINDAPQKLLQNIDHIKYLILNKKFVPFLPRLKPAYEDTVEYHNRLTQASAHEEYPSRDGYENSRHLNVVARAILIYPDLVNTWKEMGYYEICSDLNELVMQGVLLILFPPNPPNNWVCPDVNSIINRLRKLIDLGFQLTETVMEEAFHSFEHRLNEIGNLLMESFEEIRKESKSVIARSCLIQTIRPERDHKKYNLLEFFINKIDQPEEALSIALKHYKVGLKFGTNSIKELRIRSLSVHSNFYYWVLKKYGPNSKITQQCFDDIMESRIWIDLKLQEAPERDVPENLTSLAFNSICSIYLEFCNEMVLFKANHLSYLRLASNEEIIKPLFEIGLPIIFCLKLKCKLPYQINYNYVRPEVDNAQNNKRKFNEQPDKKGWIKSLEDSNSNGTENFRNNFEEFMHEHRNNLIVAQSESPAPKRSRSM